jgi:hypothetical protein
MHVPPIASLAATDPQLAALIEAEAQRQHDKLRMIPSENYSPRCAGGDRLGTDQQVLRGVRRQAAQTRDQYHPDSSPPLSRRTAHVVAADRIE